MSLSIWSDDKFKQCPGAILLDLDNTIYSYEIAHTTALKTARAKASVALAIAPGDFDSLYEKARAEVKARLGRTGASHNRLIYFQRLIELAELGTQVLAALDLEQTYWRSFLGAARAFNNVLDFLDDVRGANVPVTVVSDLTTQIQLRKIVHFGLDHRIDYVVTSEEAGEDKPARSIFDLALQKNGPISGPVWVIGDDPVSDVQGARAIGAVALQKLHAGVTPANPRADATFDEFSELQKLFALLAPA